MESLRNFRRKMEKEIKKGRAMPVKFEKLCLDRDSYEFINCLEDYSVLLNHMMRLDNFDGVVSINNLYLKPMSKNIMFVRPRTEIERRNLSVEALRRKEKFNTRFDGDCVMERTKCYFTLPEADREKCKIVINDKEYYNLIMSDQYIMGLLCECESARADYAVNMKSQDNNILHNKIMGLSNINGVMFQCMLMDEAWEEDGMLCANLCTIYEIK